jgi:hypothetical protein
VADHKVDLIKIKRKPALASQQYKINKVIVYPNYSINSDKISTTSDSIVQYKDFTIIDPDNLFKPRVFDRTLYFAKEIYTTVQIIIYL